MSQRMSKRTWRASLLGVVALAAAFAAAAATIPSPVRPTSSPLKAALLASAGQAGLDFDASALATLRGVQTEARIDGFPVAPGLEGTVVLKRFEVLAPGARITITGPDGDSSLPFPAISHFSGKIEGDEDSLVYASAQEGRLVAFVRSSAGLSYVGPDESEANYVVRSADSPLTTRDGAAGPKTCLRP